MKKNKTKETYKGMTGGLFDGTPLQEDPRLAAERKIGIAADALHAISQGNSLTDELLSVIWKQGEGRSGAPPQAFIDRVGRGIAMARAATPNPENGKTSPAGANRAFLEQLRVAAKSLLK